MKLIETYGPEREDNNKKHFKQDTFDINLNISSVLDSSLNAELIISS